MSLPDSVLAIIRATVPQVTVFDAGVPDEDESTTIPDRFGVYWPDGGTVENDQVSQDPTGELFRFQFNAVAPDRGMADWIARTVKSGIVNIKPLVPGYQCGRIQHEFSLPAQIDEQVLSKRRVLLISRYTLLAEQI
jgi:hypothetical protein